MQRSVSRSLCILIAALTGAVTSGAQPSARTPARPLLDSLYGALARGDTTALRRQLGDELVWTDGVSGAEVTKAQVLAIIGGRPPGAARRTEIDSVRVQTVGDVVFVSARRVDHRLLGGVDLPTRWRVLDAFARRMGGWQLVRHTQTWLVAPVRPAAGLDSAALQAFVGRYEVAPGYVDDVHWEGGHLVATITGYPPGARLIPVSGTVFSPEGTGALIAFERDATGRVIGYVQGYPDGRVLRRRKLP